MHECVVNMLLATSVLISRGQNFFAPGLSNEGLSPCIPYVLQCVYENVSLHNLLTLKCKWLLKWCVAVCVCVSVWMKKNIHKTKFIYWTDDIIDSKFCSTYFKVASY